MSLYRAGKLQKAIETFKQSYALFPKPTVLYNIAELYRRIGQSRESYSYYRRYGQTLPIKEQGPFFKKLEKHRWASPCVFSTSSRPGGALVFVDGKKKAVTPEDETVIQLQISGGKHKVSVTLDGYLRADQEVKAEFGEQQNLSFTLKPIPKPPMLKVDSNVKGAFVFVDKKQVGVTPLEIEVIPGTHHVEVIHNGYHKEQSSVLSKPNTLSHLEFFLRRVEDSAPTALGAQGEQGENVQATRATQTNSRGKRIWAYTTLVAGAALAASAAVLYGVGISSGNAAHEKYMATDVQAEMDRYRSDVQTSRAELIAGHVLIGASAVAFACSAYFFLSNPKKEAHKDKASGKTAFAISPTPTGVSLFVESRF